MKRVTKTAFRNTPALELGRDGVLEVVSHGTVVGYWVPRDEWERVQHALNAHQRAHSNGKRPERRPVAPLFGEEVAP